MAVEKLSEAQEKALALLENNEWNPWIDKRPGEALVRKGLAKARGHVGNVWRSREYHITAAGHEFLRNGVSQS